MFNFVLCDDNENVLTKLAKMLDSLFIKHNIDAQISFSTTNPQNFIEYIQSNKFDAVLLDIDLKSSISGLDLAEIVRRNKKDAYIIFTTAHLEYVLTAYKYKTFDYLAKPLAIERLEDTILRLFDDIKNSPTVYLKINNKTIIKQEIIKYIKKEGMKLVFHTYSRDYKVYSSFSRISAKLPSNFVRCHKSYIINLKEINFVDSNNIILQDNTICSIGPKYKNDFMEVLKNGDFPNNLAMSNYA